MSYDLQAIRETSLIWKSNYKIIRATLTYLFFRVLLVWDKTNCLSKEQEFFFFQVYSEPRVLMWGQSATFLERLFELVMLKILLDEWRFLNHNEIEQ